MLTLKIIHCLSEIELTNPSYILPSSYTGCLGCIRQRTQQVYKAMWMANASPVTPDCTLSSGWGLLPLKQFGLRKWSVFTNSVHMFEGFLCAEGLNVQDNKSSHHGLRA